MGTNLKAETEAPSASTYIEVCTVLKWPHSLKFQLKPRETQVRVPSPLGDREFLFSDSARIGKQKASDCQFHALRAPPIAIPIIPIPDLPPGDRGWGSHPRFAGDRGSAPIPIPDLPGIGDHGSPSPVPIGGSPAACPGTQAFTVRRSRTSPRRAPVWIHFWNPARIFRFGQKLSRRGSGAGDSVVCRPLTAGAPPSDRAPSLGGCARPGPGRTSIVRKVATLQRTEGP